MNQFPFLGTAGKTYQMPLMLFVGGLDSSQLMPQVPWLNRASLFALAAISSAHSPLSLRVAGLHSFQVFSQTLPIRWGPHSTVPRAITWAHAWVALGGPTSGSSQIFPNRLSGLEGPGASICSGWGHVSPPLPGCSRGNLQRENTKMASLAYVPRGPLCRPLDVCQA